MAKQLPSVSPPPSISTPVVHHTIGTPKRPLSRIRAWRALDIEQQSVAWRKAHLRQVEESDTFWKLRMRNRP
jgi:hypothetical protein